MQYTYVICKKAVGDPPALTFDDNPIPRDSFLADGRNADAMQRSGEVGRLHTHPTVVPPLLAGWLAAEELAEELATARAKFAKSKSISVGNPGTLPTPTFPPQIRVSEHVIPLTLYISRTYSHGRKKAS